MARRVLLLGVFGVFPLLLALASARLRAEEPGREDDLAYVRKLVEQAEFLDGTERRDAIRKAIGILRPHAVEDPDIASVAYALHQGLERSELQDRKLGALLDDVEAAKDPAGRDAAWATLRDALLHRGAHLLTPVSAAALPAAGMGALEAFAEQVLRALTALDDPRPTTTARPGLERVVAELERIAREARAAKDERIRKRWSRYHGTVDRIVEQGLVEEPTKRLPVLQLPLGVSKKLVETTRDGFEATTESLGHLGDAIDGKEGALSKLRESTAKVEKSLSRESYARAILDPIQDAVIERVPGLDRLLAWLDPPKGKAHLAAWAGTWQTDWGTLRIAADGKVTAKDGLFQRRRGRIDVQLVTESLLGGVWKFRMLGIEGTFLWRLVAPVMFEGHRTELKPNPARHRWNGTLVPEGR